jgi:tetratricopeptide (TPR) repeat protein
MRFAIIAVMLVATAAPAWAEGKTAKEHFALAQSAERRNDWKTAITEYEAAYALSPHADVLFNIGNDYEKLGQGRNAAAYFQRYLDEAGDAADRGEVEQRIESLRVLPSKLEVTATPLGAVVFIDGEAKGSGSEHVVEAGTHQVYIAHNGRTSVVRTIEAEFGDPVAISIDLDTKPGTLIVDSDVRGAEIRLDGDVIGYTPYNGIVPAGEHQLLVSKLGYASVQRAVTVQSEGSARVRANLRGVYDAPEPAEPGEPTTQYYFGIGYGLDVAGDAGVRYLISVGFRPKSSRWDASVLFGTLTGGNGALGAEARVYISTSRLRPYIRGAVYSGGTGSSDRAVFTEGGAGVLFLGKSVSKSTKRKLTLEYFVEANITFQATNTMDDESSVIVPIVGGVLFRYGG